MAPKMPSHCFFGLGRGAGCGVPGGGGGREGFWPCGDQKQKLGTVKGFFFKKELQKSPYFEEKQSQKSPLDYEFLLVAITRQESL
jgi:hypothetical protein